MSTKAPDLEVKAAQEEIASEKKSFTRGVSFSPGSLFHDAKNYGESLQPNVGYSGVVCMALTEFLGARGMLRTKAVPPVTAEEALAIEQAKAVGIDVRAALADAIERKTLTATSP